MMSLRLVDSSRLMNWIEWALEEQDEDEELEEQRKIKGFRKGAFRNRGVVIVNPNLAAICGGSAGGKVVVGRKWEMGAFVNFMSGGFLMFLEVELKDWDSRKIRQFRMCGGKFGILFFFIFSLFYFTRNQLYYFPRVTKSARCHFFSWKDAEIFDTPGTGTWIVDLFHVGCGTLPPGPGFMLCSFHGRC